MFRASNFKKYKPMIIAAAIGMIWSASSDALAADKNVSVRTLTSHPHILEGKPQTVYIKVALKGNRKVVDSDRPPMNLAIVIDKSGSMQGNKMNNVKSATKMLVDRLQPQDTLSIVTYDNVARVFVPATNVTNKEAIKRRINSISAEGGTALYNGVQIGAQQLEIFLSDNQVNRVILLSDGLANVGPDKPHDLALLGKQLIKKGISVSTLGIGLGYNEDLMTQLAATSDGFHQFIEDSSDLAAKFDWEYGKVSSIVANNVSVDLEFAQGVKPVQVLGRVGTIKKQNATVAVNQIYASHEIYILVEALVTKDFSNNINQSALAKVNVGYYDMQDQTGVNNNSILTTNITTNESLVSKGRNSEVLIAAAEQKAGQAQSLAIEMRDEGKIEEAKTMLENMAASLMEAGEALSANRLTRYGQMLLQSAASIDNDAQWNKNRKEQAATLQSVSFNVT